MKSIFPVILFIFCGCSAYAQAGADVSAYMKGNLYRQQQELAASIEIKIRQQRTDDLKKLLPRNRQWAKDNALFLKQLKNTPEYFPYDCKPKDSTVSIMESENGEMLTAIQFNYSCTYNYDLSLSFYFFWKGNETTHFEMQFLEHPKLKARVEDDFSMN
jgi:hypothetical protein